jgi:cytochrome c
MSDQIHIIANILAATAAGMFIAATSANAAPSAAHGEEIYQSCQDCHSLDSNDVGPKHRGVFGRKAASVADYSYSAALKGSGIVWNEDTLDKWLTDPQKLVPGSKMFFHLDAAQDRADVIEYLKERAK